jgi:hypothetical protein
MLKLAFDLNGCVTSFGDFFERIDIGGISW